MEVLSRLLLDILNQRYIVDSNSEISFCGEKDISLSQVCFGGSLTTIQHSFQRKTWQSLRIHFVEFSNSFYFSSRIKYCKREREICVCCVSGLYEAAGLFGVSAASVLFWLILEGSFSVKYKL